MEVVYQPDTNDYFAAQKYICRSVLRTSYWRFVPNILGGIFGFSLTLGILVLLQAFDRPKSHVLSELNWGLGLIVIGFVVVYVGSRPYNRALRARMFNPHGLYCSQHKISLGNDHMVVSVKNNTYTYSFGDVLRVEDDLNYVYVFIDNGAAIYIPARAFSNTESKKSFINGLSNRINR